MRIWILCIIATCYYVDKAKSDLGFGGCGSIQSVDPFNVTGVSKLTFYEPQIKNMYIKLYRYSERGMSMK